MTFSDAGDYECSLKSTVGRVSTQTTIVIEGPPGPPGKNIIYLSINL